MNMCPIAEMPLVELGELVEIVSGFAFKSAKFNDSGEGLPLVRIRDVVRGYSDTFYSGEFDEKYIVADGDYLIGMDGEFNLAKWNGGKALLNQRVCKIGELDQYLDKHYLSRFLPKALKDIEDTTPFVTVKHLSVKKIREIPIPLPPLAEQKRIAGILDAADALRAKRRESITQLDTLLQSTFLDMFGDPVTNPMKWEVVELTSLVEARDKINYGVVQPGDDFAGGKPLIRVGDFVDGKLAFENVKLIDPSIEDKYKRSRLNGRELLISCVGSIGTVCMVPSEAEGFNIARAVARVPLIKGIDRGFMLHCLRSEAVQRHFLKETRTVSQPTLNIGLIKNAPVIKPPAELQHRFASIVDSIEQQKARQRDHLAELDTLFASLQSRAFSGEL
jgi:type I restriction enzyme, S subunit